MAFILSAFCWRRIRGLWKLPDGRDCLKRKLGLVLMGRAMFIKSIIQFSLDGWGCVPLLLLDLRSNYGGGNEDNLLRKKVMTNLDSILKSRDITLPTKVHLVKAMVFPVVMYGCERWTIKKAKC